MKRSLLFLILAWGLCLVGGCGAGNPSPPPPVATHFSVATPASTIAGAVFQVTVTALDASNNVVTSFSGAVQFSSSDSQAALPNNPALANGMGTFSVTLKTAPSQTIAATSTGATPIMGTSTAIAVGAGHAARLSVSAPNASTVAVPFNFTVTADDAYNNVATSYAGIVHFSSSDVQAVLPTNSALANGMGTFPVTLKTMANATITATDTVTASLTGSSTPISVFSNAPTHLLVATLGAATTRAPISVQVKALDGANNISAGYSETVHFTSTDGKAILPADATLPNGTGNFSATLETAGNQTITVTDKVTTSLVGTSSSISVSAVPPLMISSGAPPNGTVGVTYGSSNTQIYRCFWTAGGTRGILSCQPCSGSSGCSSLPPCTSNPAISPCRQTRVVFVGFAFKATGGILPYSWSTPQNSMPPGLSVNPQNGEILGTPSLAGSYPIVVTLADSGTPQVTTPGSYTIVINNPLPPVIKTTPAPPAGAINLPYSFTFTASSTAPPLTWRVSAGTLPPGLALSPAGVLSGTPTMIGTSSITLIAEDSFKQDSVAQVFNIEIFAHGFKATGSMATARVAHTATLLNTGKVLVAGGTDASGNPVATAELYDPSTGSFSPTGNMATARAHFAATLLPSGKVLVTGGLDTTRNPLSTAEVYNPSTGTFSPTVGNMQIARATHTATLLNTGKVLVAGWDNVLAELFNPSTETFVVTGSMLAARVSHTATLLNNGKVLLTGGLISNGGGTGLLTEAELYDPTTGAFSPTLGSMTIARQFHTASLLADGKVLVTGGVDKNSGHALATAELFDPTTQLFTATKGSMGTARSFQTATILNDGTVLVTGGDNETGWLATAELYDPTAETFSPTGSMGTARSSHTATMLNGGKVLVTGGTNNGAALATAELYQ